jgi:hypothetical protein
MRARLVVAAASASALVTAAPGFARPQTTNPGAFETVRVMLTDRSLTVSPSVSGRGVTGIFIITNRGTKTHTWVIGDTTRGPGKNIGFARTLRPGQQLTIVLFLNYRGVLRYYSPGIGKRALRGIFTIM